MDVHSTASGESLVGLAPPPLPLSPATPPPQCPELDLSITHLDQLDLSITHLDERQRPAGERGGVSRRQRQVRFAVSPSRSVDQPVITMVIPESCVNQSRTEKPNNTRKQSMSAQSDVPCLEEAELNSTLALKAEIKQLEEVEFDAHKAVQEKLQNSTLTQECIRAKASKGLNFPRSQHMYRALVSVNLSHDQLISQVLQDRPALAPPTATYSSKFKSRPAEGPNLLAFYNPHQIIRETPLLPSDQIPLASPRPVPRPSNTTFHLHERHRWWEA